MPEVYRFLEEEKERQIRKASSSFFGSSFPSRRIASTKSCSRVVASRSRNIANSSALRFFALASRGRLPRLFSSAITSRMSSSKSGVMLKNRNNNGFLLARQSQTVANKVWRLTEMNAGLYTVSSRREPNSLRRTSSHSARSPNARQQAACWNFRNSAIFLGARDPGAAGVAENYEQR
jgi:hypothetical protein